MSKDKHDKQTADMFDDISVDRKTVGKGNPSYKDIKLPVGESIFKMDTQSEVFDEELFISQMKDEQTTHIPEHIKTQEQFLEWINGVFVPEEEYDENGMVIRGYN